MGGKVKKVDRARLVLRLAWIRRLNAGHGAEAPRGYSENCGTNTCDCR